MDYRCLNFIQYIYIYTVWYNAILCYDVPVMFVCMVNICLTNCKYVSTSLNYQDLSSNWCQRQNLQAASDSQWQKNCAQTLLVSHCSSVELMQRLGISLGKQLLMAKNHQESSYSVIGGFNFGATPCRIWTSPRCGFARALWTSRRTWAFDKNGEHQL